VLKDFETKDLEALLKVSKIRQYEPKEMIIKEGESDKRIYFLISGEVWSCLNLLTP
jgi:CRP/FNR family cyclic AMP-dependent transcriptional regulator